MKYEDACYIAGSAKHINKTSSVVLPFSSKICLTFYNEFYFLYTQDLFLYSMSFKKELISSLMSSSDIHDIESAYYQATKNKIEMMNEDFSNLSHPSSPHKTTLKICSKRKSN